MARMDLRTNPVNRATPEQLAQRVEEAQKRAKERRRAQKERIRAAKARKAHVRGAKAPTGKGGMAAKLAAAFDKGALPKTVKGDGGKFASVRKTIEKYNG